MELVFKNIISNSIIDDKDKNNYNNIIKGNMFFNCSITLISLMNIVIVIDN